MSGKKKKKGESPNRIAARNRKARHNYEVVEEFEAGICLVGTEIKSLRTGKASIIDSYGEIKDSEIFLINAYIPEYEKSSGYFNHATRRPRKLLLHKREIKKLMGKVLIKGMTLIALDIHFNEKGIAKVKLGLCKGKSKYDKRQTEKDRDWERKKQRVIREG